MMAKWIGSLPALILAIGIAAFVPAPPAISQQSQQKVPDEYYQLMGRANYAFQNANSTADYAEAVRLFQQAAGMAPWLPDTYYNLGKAQEKAKQFDDAIRSLQHYLDLKPDASDRDKVHAEIEQVSGEAQQAAQPPASQAAQAQQQEQSNFVGKWKWGKTSDGGLILLVISRDASGYSVTCSPSSWTYWYQGRKKYRTENFTTGDFTAIGANKIRFTLFQTEGQTTPYSNVGGNEAHVIARTYELRLSSDDEEMKGLAVIRWGFGGEGASATDWREPMDPVEVTFLRVD